MRRVVAPVVSGCKVVAIAAPCARLGLQSATAPPPRASAFDTLFDVLDSWFGIESNPKTVLLTHPNRLKNAGL